MKTSFATNAGHLLWLLHGGLGDLNKRAQLQTTNPCHQVKREDSTPRIRAFDPHASNPALPRPGIHRNVARGEDPGRGRGPRGGAAGGRGRHGERLRALRDARVHGVKMGQVHGFFSG